MKHINLLFFICAFGILFNFSCGKKDTTGGGNNNSTGKDSILINIGSNVVIPNYQSLATAVNALDAAIADFNQSPDNTKLSNLQALFKTAYIAFESSSEFEFGPDDQKSLSALNLFPVTTARIDSNIIANNNNLDAFANKSAKGFPALDYLLFGADNSVVLINYTSDAEAGNRKQYLAAVSAEIKLTVNTILNAWLPAGGNYVNTFISSAGTSIGSSLGQLINSVDQDYEILKNYRLGIPLGKQTMDTLKPAEVEAYYSGISSRLALAQLTTIQGIFLGTGSQGNGMGLGNYLVKANAQYNGGSLYTAIKNQFTVAIAKLQALPDPLSATIQTNATNVNAAYAEVQKLLVLLKTDMPSALGVLITYADNDGD
jgi:uncharacterized protein